MKVEHIRERHDKGPRVFVSYRSRRPAETGRQGGSDHRSGVQEAATERQVSQSNEAPPAKVEREPVRDLVNDRGQERVRQQPDRVDRSVAPPAAPAAAGGEGSFHTLGLSAATLAAVDRAGYTMPTPVQAGLIPRAIAGVRCARPGPLGHG